MWYDRINQSNFFPGDIIYKVHPIFEELDINKVRILEVTFDGKGLKHFYYQYVLGNGIYHWERDSNYYNEVSFHYTIESAKDWCDDQGKKYTIYD